MPPGQRDLYSVLGVRRDASAEDLKRAYYNEARRLHPDKNVLPGETELFLEVQKAYEVLSNPERRARYDATLSPDEQATSPFAWNVMYSRPNLVHTDEAQLIYALLEAAPPRTADDARMTPLNICLLLDRSTSMSGDKMDLAKATAVKILGLLRPEDLFSLVVFSDRAEVLLPSGYHGDTKKAQSRIQGIQTGGATEIYQGLKAAVGELNRGLAAKRVSHLILLTDGHTYGDEQPSLELADEAAKLGINISGFGIGGDWNDVFLDSLVGRTGGNSTYIADPGEIQKLLLDKFKALARIVIDDIILETSAIEGVRMQYAFRLQPEGGPVAVQEEMHLGPVLQDQPLLVLMEFVVDPAAATGDEITLLEGNFKPQNSASPRPLAPVRARLRRPIGDEAASEVPPQSIVNALSRLALYRLQERARQEADAGEYEAATRHLSHLALQLQAQGHHDLSKTVALEAENMGSVKPLTQEGSKAIKYGTRSLILPAVEKPE